MKNINKNLTSSTSTSEASVPDGLGHICVQKTKNIDAAACLGEIEWVHCFDVVPITLKTWEALDAFGFWDTINASCDVLIDLYEEEWVGVDRLPVLQVETEAQLRSYQDPNSPSQIDEEVLAFLRSLAELVSTARQRGVPVIFAL